MREYCGCRSLATIDEPTREHDEVVRLISRLRKEQDGVFPAAPAGLGTEDREAVEAVRGSAGGALVRPTT
ncbi:hypothetical protein ACFYW9_14190 [Streptomyces sp. NPDC002698]|uniref:hypothetical protein n=1 Tax=Streptomyces sp. NPDC002698 TaxID=3364660 RepID=UPI0036CF53F7